METSVSITSRDGGASSHLSGMAPLSNGLRPEGLPDILLDGDRLNMLLDIICTDYITASYASRENGKKVVIKALQKLSLSVYASTPTAAAAAAHHQAQAAISINVHDAVFADRCRVFYEELLVDFDRKRQQKLAELASQAASQLPSASLPITDDAVVKEALKPKLVQFVEEILKERDRQLRAVDATSVRAQPQQQYQNQPATGSTSSAAPRSLPLSTSTPGAAASSFVAGTTAPSSIPIQAASLPASTWQTGEIRMEGWLRKKGQHVNLWRDRYFMIRSTPNGTHYLCYFRKKGEKEPRDWYILGPGTTVDEVRESPSKIETKPLFTFRIRHMTHGNGDDANGDDTAASAGGAGGAGGAAPLDISSPMMSSSQLLSHQQTSRATGVPFDMLQVPMSPDAGSGNTDYEYDQRPTLKKTNSRRFRSRAAAAAAAATAATAVVLTGGLAGVGIGMGMGMSAAAAASAGAAGAIIVQNRNKGPIALAAESLETAIWWRNSIVECIAQAEEQWRRYLNWYMDKDHELSLYYGSGDVNVNASDLDGLADPVASSTPAPPLSAPPPSFASSSGVVPAAARTKPPLSTSQSVGSIGSTGSMGSLGLKTGGGSIQKPIGSGSSTGRPRAGSFGTLPRSIAKTFRTSATFSQETSWRLYEYSSKLRVDVEKPQSSSSFGGGATSAGAATTKSLALPPALRTSIKVMASPKKVFDLLMDPTSSFYKLNHVIQDAQILEANAQDHSDVMYWKLAPTYLWPVHVASRDLCLLRYWRKEQDASYFICFQSTTTHLPCPSTTIGSTSSETAAVRGSVLGGGFIISPRVHEDGHFDECWVTFTVQMNPKGWIDSPLPRAWYYMHAYGVYFLEMITALSVLAPDIDHTPRPFGCAEAGGGGDRGERGEGGEGGADPSAASSSGQATQQPPSQLIVSDVQYKMLDPFRTDLSVKNPLPPKFWSEPDATTFLVRGPQYFTTHTKIKSAPQAFRLISVELLKAVASSSSHNPNQSQSSRHHATIRKIGLGSFEPQGFGDTNPLILVINFMIPGPPNHSLLLYFTPGNPDELKKNSVFADLCHSFFRGNGENDEYRTKRLKLIPRVVQGTWAIREGVGCTPAILGTKVNHSYFQGAHFLEVDYDISSSTVASGIVKMIMGLARDLVIDLAFVIEAQTPLELPERVLGCVRLNGIDLRHAVPYVKQQQQQGAQATGSTTSTTRAFSRP